MKTASQVEGQSLKSPEGSPSGNKRGKNPRSLANLVAPWKPGQSGNPGGKPKRDLASEIAQAIFNENPELIYKAFSKALGGGNAYAFQVIADRAFGKLTDKIQVGADDELLAKLQAGRKRASQE